MAKRTKINNNRTKNGFLSILEAIIIILCSLIVIAMLTSNFMFKKQASVHEIFGKYIYLNTYTTMGESVPENTLVYGEKVQTDTLINGDVVLVNVTSGSSEDNVILRIQQIIENENGSKSFILKGDEFEENQSIPVTEENIIAKCTTKNEYLGKMIVFSISTEGFLTAIVVPCLFIIIFQIIHIVKVKGSKVSTDTEDYEVLFSTLNSDDEEEDDDSQNIKTSQQNTKVERIEEPKPKKETENRDFNSNADLYSMFNSAIKNKTVIKNSAAEPQPPYTPQPKQVAPAERPMQSEIPVSKPAYKPSIEERYAEAYKSLYSNIAFSKDIEVIMPEDKKKPESVSPVITKPRENSYQNAVKEETRSSSVEIPIQNQTSTPSYFQKVEIKDEKSYNNELLSEIDMERTIVYSGRRHKNSYTATAVKQDVRIEDIGADYSSRNTYSTYSSGVKNSHIPEGAYAPKETVMPPHPDTKSNREIEELLKMIDNQNRNKN